MFDFSQKFTNKTDLHNPNSLLSDCLETPMGWHPVQPSSLEIDLSCFLHSLVTYWVHWKLNDTAIFESEKYDVVLIGITSNSFENLLVWQKKLCAGFMELYCQQNTNDRINSTRYWCSSYKFIFSSLIHRTVLQSSKTIH